MIHFNELRAQRDRQAQSLAIFYFWGHEDWIEDICLNFRNGGFHRAMAHLVENHKFGALGELGTLANISARIAELELAEIEKGRHAP